MIETVEAIHPFQINKQADGTVTVSILNPIGLTCVLPDGSMPPTRPAIVGDVYSVQPPNGVFGNVVVQARVAGTAGPFELAKISGKAVVWAPKGSDSYAVQMPYVTDLPNV